MDTKGMGWGDASRQKVMRFKQPDQFPGPFPSLLHLSASRNARAFARAWLSADRSVGIAFPTVHCAWYECEMICCALLLVQTGQLGFSGRKISTIDASIAMFICASRIGVSCLRIEAELSDATSIAIEVSNSFTTAPLRIGPGDAHGRDATKRGRPCSHHCKIELTYLITICSDKFDICVKARH